MKKEKRYIVDIREKRSCFFLINSRRVRLPVKFIVSESEILLIKSKLRKEEIYNFDIIEIVNDNESDL